MALNDHSVDLEEVEGLIRSGGTSEVGSGNCHRSANSSYCNKVFEPQNRKRWMTIAFISFLLLLIVAANTGRDSSDGGKIVKQDSSMQVIDFADPDPPTAAPDGEIVITEPQVMQWAIKPGAAFQLFGFDLLADLWLAWGFQENCMYSPVHY